MDYRKTASRVLEKTGGRSNLVSVCHCATRLRMVLSDYTRLDKQAVEEIDGVKGVFEAAGQVHIVFGMQSVHKIYEEMIAIAKTEV